MQATIEIDLGPLEAEWEAVAFRLPKKDEIILIDGKRVERATSDYQYVPQLIVRRKWVWPSWLKARWYYENAGGAQFFSNNAPKLHTGYWLHNDTTSIRGMLDVPKIGGDWKLSLRENPNWKGA